MVMHVGRGGLVLVLRAWAPFSWAFVGLQPSVRRILAGCCYDFRFSINLDVYWVVVMIFGFLFFWRGIVVYRRSRCGGGVRQRFSTWRVWCPGQLHRPAFSAGPLYSIVPWLRIVCAWWWWW